MLLNHDGLTGPWTVLVAQRRADNMSQTYPTFVATTVLEENTRGTSLFFAGCVRLNLVRLAHLGRSDKPT
jgi:hypothetical protein